MNKDRNKKSEKADYEPKNGLDFEKGEGLLPVTRRSMLSSFASLPVFGPTQRIINSNNELYPSLASEPKFSVDYGDTFEPADGSESYSLQDNYSFEDNSGATDFGTKSSDEHEIGSYGFISENATGIGTKITATYNQTTEWDRSYQFEFLLRCSEYNPNATFNNAAIRWRTNLDSDTADSLRLRTFNTDGSGETRPFAWFGGGVKERQGTYDFSWEEGVWYWIRGEVDESAGEAHAKVWKAQNEEPADYQVSAQITTGVDRELPYAILVDGKFGSSGITFDIARASWDFKNIKNTLEIQDARVVQTVADTIVTPQNGTTPLYEEGDPPIVAGRNAAVVFGLTAPGFSFDDVPSGTSFEITITRNPDNDGPSDSFSLSTTQAENLATGNDPVSVLEDADMPVFAPSADLNAIEVEITAVNESSDADIIDELDDSMMLTVGPDEDIEVAAPRRLNAGFIQLRDPQEGENYGVFGQGTPRNFEQTVSEGADRLQELLPISQLNVYRADDPVDAVFATNDDGERLDRLRQADIANGDYPIWDASQASEALEPSSDSGEFVRGDPFEEFDLEVLVAPGADFRTDDEGNFERNDDYFSFHNGGGEAGFDPRDGETAVVVLGQDGNISVPRSELDLDVFFAQQQSADYTVAHEAGHEFADRNVYAGPGGNDPLAQRVDSGDPTDGLDNDDRDENHARQEDTELDNDRIPEDVPGVRSTLFRLAGGTFERASPLQEEANPDFPDRLQSVMSYTSTAELIQREDADDNQPVILALDERTGSDSRIYRENIENTTAIGSVSTNTAEQTVLSGVGILRDDGTIEFVTFNTRQGVPSPDESDAALSFEAVGPDEQVLAQRDVSSQLSIFDDQFRPGADGGEPGFELPQLNSEVTADDVAIFAVPFPDETTTLRVVNSEADVTTEVNPLTRTLRGLIGDIPESGFIPDPEGSRTQLYNRLDNARKQIDGGRFRPARNVLESIRSTLRNILEDDYETTAALEPTKQDVLDAVQNRIDRLDALAGPPSGSGRGNKD